MHACKCFVSKGMLTIVTATVVEFQTPVSVNASEDGTPGKANRPLDATPPYEVTS